MRRIRNSEIRESARIMAKCFSEYPLYNVFFRDDERKERRIFYFFWYRIYTRRTFTYITPDKDLVVSFQKPEDRLGSSAGLWLNPRFFFGFLKNIPLKAILLVIEFGKMEKELQDRFYNPRTDCFAQAICVLKESRGSGIILQALNELDDGRPVFCETHIEANVRLYEHLGMEVCGKTDWHGVTHYAMKKRGSYIRFSGPMKRQEQREQL